MRGGAIVLVVKSTRRPIWASGDPCGLHGATIADRRFSCACLTDFLQKHMSKLYVALRRVFLVLGLDIQSRFIYTWVTTDGRHGVAEQPRGFEMKWFDKDLHEVDFAAVMHADEAVAVMVFVFGTKVETNVSVWRVEDSVAYEMANLDREKARELWGIYAKCGYFRTDVPVITEHYHLTFLGGREGDAVKGKGQTQNLAYNLRAALKAEAAN